MRDPPLRSGTATGTGTGTGSCYERGMDDELIPTEAPMIHPTAVVGDREKVGEWRSGTGTGTGTGKRGLEPEGGEGDCVVMDRDDFDAFERALLARLPGQR